jgi:hypothetical protein
MRRGRLQANKYTEMFSKIIYLMLLRLGLASLPLQLGLHKPLLSKKIRKSQHMPFQALIFSNPNTRHR